jgi:hypothetical protein
MLAVDVSPVVSIPTDSEAVPTVPLIAIPLATPEKWVAEPALPPEPPRFLSEDEESEQDDWADQEAGKQDQPLYSSASEPAAEAAPPQEAAAAPEPEAADMEETEPPVAPAAPKFAELAEEPMYTQLSRESTPEFGNSFHKPAKSVKKNTDPVYAEPGDATEPDEAALRELDKPAFLRRLFF